MKIQITPRESFKIEKWSGGTTCELLIFPAKSTYQDRDFKFRISTAKVQKMESTFTPLPGVARTLMVLSGSITLQHENRYTKHLEKFELDEFMGDWKTRSIGKCSDFNLMCKGKTNGKLRARSIDDGEELKLHINKSIDRYIVFALDGTIEINIEDKHCSIQKGDLFVLENHSESVLSFKGIQKSELIVTEIVLG